MTRLSAVSLVVSAMLDRATGSPKVRSQIPGGGWSCKSEVVPGVRRKSSRRPIRFRFSLSFFGMSLMKKDPSRRTEPIYKVWSHQRSSSLQAENNPKKRVSGVKKYIFEFQVGKDPSRPINSNPPSNHFWSRQKQQPRLDCDQEASPC